MAVVAKQLLVTPVEAVATAWLVGLVAMVGSVAHSLQADPQADRCCILVALVAFGSCFVHHGSGHGLVCVHLVVLTVGVRQGWNIVAVFAEFVVAVVGSASPYWRFVYLDFH